MSTALLTDQYELTMLDAAIGSGRHERQCVFEVFARRLPDSRRYGIVAGTGRLLELIDEFRFGDDELSFLARNSIVSPTTIDWLANYRFTGDISGYREGDAYFPGSPVLTVEGTFAEAVLLETLALSVLNYDSAVASAAARMVSAAGARPIAEMGSRRTGERSAVASAAARMVSAAGARPIAEMGSRRTGERSAVASARAAYIAGFSATSNLEAGRSWGVPTMGTAAHSFTLLHDSEEEAFQAQVDALGPSTTLLVDTYDVENAVELAVKVAGTGLGAVRIDSGDLATQVASVRAQLDSLGATKTRITVTNDLDEHAIAALRAAPVDSFGVGTSVVTGSGYPAAGMVYKLVAHHNDAGEWVSVAKKSTAKATVGGHKAAIRTMENGVASSELIYQTVDARPEVEGRELIVPLMTAGTADAQWLRDGGTLAARDHREDAMAELPQTAFRLSRGEPVLPTLYR